MAYGTGSRTGRLGTVPARPLKWAGGKAGRGVGGTRQEAQDWKRRRSHLGHSPLTATTPTLYSTTQPGKGVWKGVWVTTLIVGKRERDMRG